MYRWLGNSLVLVVPSPKSHSIDVVAPRVVLLNSTIRGALPELKSIENEASGGVGTGVGTELGTDGGVIIGEAIGVGEAVGVKDGIGVAVGASASTGAGLGASVGSGSPQDAIRTTNATSINAICVDFPIATMIQPSSDCE